MRGVNMTGVYMYSSLSCPKLYIHFKNCGLKCWLLFCMAETKVIFGCNFGATLITYSHRTLTDSLTKSLTLYHV